MNSTSRCQKEQHQMTRTTAAKKSGSPADKRPRSVRDRLMETDRGFPDSELKVARILLANYPAAGLTTVSKLAKQASVSDPTVLRLAQRLGFEGFAEMQAALLAEVEAHMRSPLTITAEPAQRQKPNLYQTFFAETLAQCEATSRETATADYERAAALLADPRLRVLCLGGRFSRFLAGILQRCLHQLRDGTHHLDSNAADLVDQLAAIGKRHVLAVFDYRRYQADVVDFAQQAKARGARVILFTDNWKSPIGASADVVFSAPTATASPFDTLVTPMLQIEAIVAGVAGRLEPEWRSRAAAFEEVRNRNRVTLDGIAKIKQSPKRARHKRGEAT
jgi:DNA-binding MurR/RpiR family transcriptional regulator